jgi:UDP-glucose 4-epimerase
VLVVVTGASGFLGRATVPALLARGHHVRALVRDAARMPRGAGSERLEVVESNLKNAKALDDALRGADAVIHLAVTMEGDDFSMLAGTVVGTEALLAAMARAACRRLVLCSSFSVYDWARMPGEVSEACPVPEDPHPYGAYAAAKLWQERLARRAEERDAVRLTIVRPGFIWGAGNDYLPCLGQRVGSQHLVFGPLRRLPLTHVDNCADLLAHVLDDPRAIGEVFNAVDDDSVRAWRYVGEYIRGSGGRGLRIPLPYHAVRLVVELAHRASGWLFGGRGKLPSVLMPARFVTRFAPFRYRTEKLREVLGWRPPAGFAECAGRTWGGGGR